MMRYYALIVLVLFFAVESGLAVRPRIWEIVDEIAYVNELHSSHVGRGTKSRQWKHYLALRTEATAEELVDLTDYTNPVVRCYAFLALVERKHPDVFTILLQHSNDTDTVTTQSGCIVWRITVRKMFAGVLSRNTFSDSAKTEYKFTPAQQATIDSVFALPSFDGYR